MAFSLKDFTLGTGLFKESMAKMVIFELFENSKLAASVPRNFLEMEK